MSEEIKSVLMLVDSQSLYYSAKALYGEKARINFRELKNLVAINEKTGNPVDFIKAVVVVANFVKEEQFLTFLRKVGYDIVQFEESAVKEISNILRSEDLNNYTDVVVCSGSGELISVFEEIKMQHPSLVLRVVSFADSLHKKIPEVVDSVTYLTSDILLKQKSSEGTKQEDQTASVSV